MIIEDGAKKGCTADFRAEASTKKKTSYVPASRGLFEFVPPIKINGPFEDLGEQRKWSPKFNLGFP